METVIDKHRMYSPSSCASVEEKFRKGKIGRGHELCYPGQRARCKRARRCLGDDKHALNICDETFIVIGLRGTEGKGEDNAVQD